MLAVKGIYRAGNVKLVERAPVHDTSEVLVIFPARTKRVIKIGGLFKGHDMDDEEIVRELRSLSKRSMEHLEQEAREEQ